MNATESLDSITALNVGNGWEYMINFENFPVLLDLSNFSETQSSWMVILLFLLLLQLFWIPGRHLTRIQREKEEARKKQSETGMRRIE